MTTTSTHNDAEIAGLKKMILALGIDEAHKKKEFDRIKHKFNLMTIEQKLNYIQEINGSYRDAHTLCRVYHQKQKDFADNVISLFDKKSKQVDDKIARVILKLEHIDHDIEQTRSVAKRDSLYARRAELEADLNELNEDKKMLESERIELEELYTDASNFSTQVFSLVELKQAENTRMIDELNAKLVSAQHLHEHLKANYTTEHNDALLINQT